MEPGMKPVPVMVMIKVDPCSFALGGTRDINTGKGLEL
jgi:hypothetical protein